MSPMKSNTSPRVDVAAIRQRLAANLADRLGMHLVPKVKEPSIRISAENRERLRQIRAAAAAAAQEPEQPAAPVAAVSCAELMRQRFAIAEEKPGRKSCADLMRERFGINETGGHE